MASSRPMGMTAAAVVAFWALAAMAVPGIRAVRAAETPPPGMVRIPAATFTMGRNDGAADEAPAHRVAVGTFVIDRLEVTNADFAAFLVARGGPADARGRRLFDWDDGDARIHERGGRFTADPGFGDHPVVEASWHGARAYCRWRGKRLASEAEWELAARGISGRAYPWGEQAPDGTRARYGVGWGETVPVGSLTRGATPEGVMNLAGNVHEWVGSLSKPYPFDAGDGREDAQATGERVTRGGAADTGVETLRATWRGAGVSRNPRSGHHNIGFRCANSDPR